MSWELPSTIRGSAGSEEAKRSLVIVAPGGVETFWLENDRRITLGRSPENQIVIEDPSMSRVHAAVHVGAQVELEDLGSANGTKVRGALLAGGERRTLSPGDTFELGSTIVVFQRITRNTRARLRTHGYFEARLEEECSQRTRGVRSPFAVIRVRIAGDASGPELEAAIAPHLKASDVVAVYAPGQIEILLLETIRSSAEKIIGDLVKTLARGGVLARVGAAFHPEHGIGAEALIAAASAALEGPEPGRARVVVTDPAMMELYRVLERIAQGTISVLLLGETGVGKEIIAETIHQKSPRRDVAFLRLNCAALSESLVESELFGHEKGAFTGADRAKPGLLETTVGGTLFLDEVGELPLATQAKLLRAIEQREVLRVGALKPRSIDVRIVSATNRDLENEVALGGFRRDLYYRLNGATLAIPALRDRPSEIEPLAELFLERASKELGAPEPPVLSPAALELMRRYSWPGNIRELKNVIDRALLLSDGEVIEPIHLPFEKISAAWPDRGERLVLSPEEDAQKARILEALEQCAGNQTRAAERLGVARQTLTKWLNRYGLPRPRKGARETT